MVSDVLVSSGSRDMRRSLGTSIYRPNPSRTLFPLGLYVLTAYSVNVTIKSASHIGPYAYQFFSEARNYIPRDWEICREGSVMASSQVMDDWRYSPEAVTT